MGGVYLKGKMGYSFVENKIDNTTNENLEDFSDSLILKNIELVYGVIPANVIIKYVSQHVGKSRSDILSNFETFSKNIKQVYGEVEGKKFLSKLPNTYKKIPRAYVWVVP
ncbi:MAG: hypothetical protein IH842_05720 [Thaumarchaeota archaeon]|nr:hypothetical protein [Nitrososphaerota archaeon]